VRGLIARLAGPGFDADDLCHEVFVIAWRKLEGLNEIAGRGWLCAIAIRVVAGARRRAHFRKLVGLDYAAHKTTERTPATEFERQEASTRVYLALEHLSEKKRTAFILHDLQGLTGEQISSILDIPIKTVWSRLGHARREFELQLRKHQLREDQLWREGAR
jgi:RNA polymerase sigma-70 factor (ECF subfamily)